MFKFFPEKFVGSRWVFPLNLKDRFSTAKLALAKGMDARSKWNWLEGTRDINNREVALQAKLL